MKTCDEMTGCVFLRIEEYQRAKKKRNRLISKAVFSVIGICIAVITAVFALPHSEENTPLEPINSTMISDGDKAENKIIINKIDSISSNRMYICLHSEDFVPMTDEELIEYYGTNVFPTVPEDLVEWEREGSYGIFRRNGGTGEVYHDAIAMNYSNEDFSRSINIELTKNKFPFSCYGSFEIYYEKSIISGVEAYIGQTDNGYYLIEMMYRNVGFRIIIEGLTITEMEDMVESILD